MRLVVINHITLDGVMQGPDDPTRTPAAASGTAVGLRHWNELGGPYKDALNRAPRSSPATSRPPCVT